MTGYALNHGLLEETPDLSAAVWIDLLEPSRETEREVEAHLGIDLPTREDMVEIEISSRLYEADGALFLTVELPAGTAEGDTRMGPVTFVLHRERLVTIRYHDPRPFRTFSARASRAPVAGTGGEAVFLGLLETVVDRLADIIEQAGRSVAPISRDIFQPEVKRRVHDYRPHLETIGKAGDLVSNIRDSLLTVDRAIGFYIQHHDHGSDTDPIRARLKTLTRDVHSIGDHAGFLAGKVTLLLDATLGMINIEQNAIIKIFSVAAVVFLPPTLIASIYGMNFQFMPELTWPLGYPFAIVLMIVSALLPYAFFKRKGWL